MPREMGQMAGTGNSLTLGDSQLSFFGEVAGPSGQTRSGRARVTASPFLPPLRVSGRITAEWKRSRRRREPGRVCAPVHHQRCPRRPLVLPFSRGHRHHPTGKSQRAPGQSRGSQRGKTAGCWLWSGCLWNLMAPGHAVSQIPLHLSLTFKTI